MQIIEISHPLKDHYLTIIRDKETNFENFDAHFVNENIYSGFEISDVHKKKLHQFVIGNQGIAIKNKILKNKQDKEAKKIEIEGLVKSLINNVGFGLAENELNSFLKLKEKDSKDVDSKIADLRKSAMLSLHVQFSHLDYAIQYKVLCEPHIDHQQAKSHIG